MDLELINVIFWFGFGVGFTIAFGIAVIAIQIILIKQNEKENENIANAIFCNMFDNSGEDTGDLGSAKNRR